MMDNFDEKEMQEEIFEQLVLKQREKLYLTPIQDSDLLDGKLFGVQYIYIYSTFS